MNPELTTHALKAAGLGSEAKSVLVNQALHADSAGRTKLDVTRISEETCLDESSVHAGLAECMQNGIMRMVAFDIMHIDEIALKQAARPFRDYGDGLQDEVTFDRKGI